MRGVRSIGVHLLFEKTCTVDVLDLNKSSLNCFFKVETFSNRFTLKTNRRKVDAKS